ncbi:unnamed protein product [Rotaria magnacalcarata]|uniref:ATP-dependent DNA helicase n=2 Tax=Rotaria magnacalcarata TaxID=392030 RepID=A0A815UAT9_9BILA|nr:unnamed protein product [Rotaria magnacalcarata]
MGITKERYVKTSRGRIEGESYPLTTCNPKWQEIQQELTEGRAPSDRHDLLARVFRQKLIKLVNIITKSHVFGPTRCWMYSIEWKKRGLPHAHILIWLRNKIKADQIDSVISAELPDPERDPQLFEIIIKTMIHCPCGSINSNSPCMENKKCTKRYPKQLLHDTETGDDGYPSYRRRSSEDGGIKVKIKMRINNSIQEIEIDNKWVVAYCPLLSRTFQAHINMEYCNSVKSIKYICKYVNEGSDQAVFGLGRDGAPVDEISNYQLANEPLLVPDQRAAYNAILNQIEKKAGGIIFLDAPGGTGKTFVINLLLAKIRHQSKIAIAVASSGIAATLLQGGRTAHSTLKLPLKFLENQTHVCSITKGTSEAKVLQECELIVWDECTMAHRYALEALNHTLQDLRNNGKNMGGVVVLIAGDFRQTLPVIPKGTMADELKACLKSSYLWRHVVPFKLSTNMRVHLQGDVSAGRFAEQLLAIGKGEIPADPVSGLINISDNFCNIVESVEELKNKVFPNIQTHYKDHKWLCERAILAPKNVNVNAINLQIQQQLPGEAISYKSIDTVKDIDMVVQYPTEFLNSLEPSGMPPHNLRLKIGSSIMLLRNLDAPRLCNGTRLCVKTLMPHVIEATIMTGCAKGEDVFIPKIPLLPSDIPFEFTRLQFPVRLAFAMSINKAQGQSLKVAGVNLETSCFSHGQLYVACSRVGTGKNLYVFAPDGKTKNVVYKTALQ